MALIYKYKNLSSQNHVYLQEGTNLGPGMEGWTHQKIEGNPLLQLIDTKDDGTIEGIPVSALDTAISAYLEANPLDGKIASAVANYMQEHPVDVAVANYMQEHPIDVAIADYLKEHPIDTGNSEQQPDVVEQS